MFAVLDIYVFRFNGHFRWARTMKAESFFFLYMQYILSNKKSKLGLARSGDWGETDSS